MIDLLKNNKPKEKLYLTVFGIAVVGNLAGIFYGFKTAELFFKPLLLISLIAFFVSGCKKSTTFFYFLVGLVLCLMGDVFLMFNKTSSDNFFLAGLSSFLLGHLAYFISFKRLVTLRPQSDNDLNYVLPGMIVFFTIIFLSQLIPYVGDTMRLPVTVYAMVITLMMIGASKVHSHISSDNSNWLLIGALLFALSDCILSMSLFRFDSNSVPFRVSIMGTYIMAQFLLVTQFKKLLNINDIRANYTD